MADPNSRLAQVLDWLVNKVPEGGDVPQMDPTGVGYSNVGTGPRDWAKALTEAILTLTPSGGEESIAGLPGGFFRRRVGEPLSREVTLAKMAHGAQVERGFQADLGDPNVRGWKKKFWGVEPSEAPTVTFSGGRTPQKAIREAGEINRTLSYDEPLEFDPHGTFAINPGLKRPKFLPRVMDVKERDRVQAILDMLTQNYEDLINAGFRTRPGPMFEQWGEILTRPSKRGYFRYRTPELPLHTPPGSPGKPGTRTRTWQIEQMYGKGK